MMLKRCWIGWAACAQVVLMQACGSDQTASDSQVVAAAQQLRAGRGHNGEAFIAVDILATLKNSKRVVSCSNPNLDLNLAYSVSGEDGPFEVFATERDLICEVLQTGDFALVIDNSGSEEVWIEELKTASRSILDRLIPLGGRASVVRVSTDASVLAEVTWQRDVLHEALDQMYVNAGWTALYDGVRMGNETLERADPSAGFDSYPDAETFCDASRKLGIIAVTDGHENNSSHQQLKSEEYPGDGIDTDLADLYSLSVGGVTTPIYTIGLGDNVEHDELSDLAMTTGGRHMAIEQADDVNNAFDLIADYAEFRHQFCTTLPEDICGTVHVRVHHETRVSGNRGGRRGPAPTPTPDVEDEIIAVQIPCLPGEQPL